MLLLMSATVASSSGATTPDSIPVVRSLLNYSISDLTTATLLGALIQPPYFINNPFYLVGQQFLCNIGYRTVLC